MSGVERAADQAGSRENAGAADALVRAALTGDDERADTILRQFPELPAESLACTLVLADADAAGRWDGDVNRPVGGSGWPPLLMLCSSRYRAGDADVDAARLAIARRLLEMGADANAGTPEADTARGYRTVLGAAVGRARSAPLARLLLAAGADAADGPTLYEGCATWEAVRHGDRESLEALLGAEPPHWHVCHALPQSLPYDDETLTRRLLAAGGDPNWTVGTWGFGGNCLHEALVLDAGPAVVRALLEHGAHVEFRDRSGRTPLALAVCLARGALAGLLRQHGAREEVGEVDRWVGACFAHDVERATEIQESAGRLSLRPADHVWVCRAARGADAQAVAMLLSGGADAAAVDDDGQTALHLAVLAGDVTACRALLAAGADPRAQNYAGRTAADCALGLEDGATREELATLLRAGERREPALGYDDPARAAAFERAADAVACGDVDALRALLAEHPELAKARSSRPHRCTLLHYVAANGVEGERQRTPANAVEVIDLLLAAGSDPNVSCFTYRGGPDQTPRGLLAGSVPPRAARLTLPMIAALARGGARLDAVDTLLVRLSAGGRVDPASPVAGRALVESVTLGETELVCALLEAGVDVNARRGDGATALHQAAFDGDAALVETLLSRGADPTMRDDVFDGPPAGWAKAGGHEKLAARLARSRRP